MVIAVDAGCLGISDERLKGGVYQVAVHLFEELSIIDRKNTYILYSFHPIDEVVMKRFGKKVHNQVITPAKGWMKIWVPMQLLQDRPDIFLGLNQAIPQQVPHVTKYKSVVLFYDIAFEKYPTMYSYTGSLEKLHDNSKYAAEHADKIVSISQSTRKDIQSIYGRPKENITVAYPGVDPIFFSNTKAYPYQFPYFLFVGAFKKTKNVPAILKAFDYFSEKVDTEYHLLLVGADKWMDPDIEDVFRRMPMKLQKRVKTLGFVEEGILPMLYKGAVGFVAPSFYEGFGLPVLEAMASGIPVISSNHGSIPEIIQDGGILVDPRDARALSEAMYQVVQNPALKSTIVAKSLKRAKMFSWEKFARGVYDVLI